MRYHFGVCVLDTACRELSRAGQVVPLEPKAYQVLVYLVEHRHRVVTRAELLEHVWRGIYVEDGAVTRCVRALRLAVGDSPAEQRAIQTRRGHGYRFLARVDEHDAGEADQVGPRAQGSVDLPPSPPGAEVPLDLSQASAEYKPVTVLCGVFDPKLAGRLALDERHTLLEAVTRLIDRVVSIYGGTRAEVASDRVTVVFGAPAVQEEHAHHAVLAALALQERWPEFVPPTSVPLGPALPIQFGLDSGLVIAAGSSTGPLGRPAAVAGEVPIRAVALAQGAAAGTIAVSAETARLLTDWIEVAEILPTPEPGHAEPIRTYRVVGRIPNVGRRGRRGERERSPFVGRADELMLLRGRLARVVAGQGSTVEIVGQAGIGKSRLLAEFRRSIAIPITYLAARCLAHENTTPYAPVGELLAQLCGITDAQAPEQREVLVRTRLAMADLDPAAWTWTVLDLLGIAGTTAVGPEARRARTFTALHQLFLHQAARQPLVVEVDDMHWVDATSEAFLTELMTRLPSAPALLLVSYRPGYRPSATAHSSVTQIALAPLSSEDCARMMEDVRGSPPIDHEVAKRLVARSQGNPFYLEELAQAARDDGADSSPVPGTVLTVVGARLDRLPAGAKHLLQSAAIIGMDAPVSLLQTLAGMEGDAFASSLHHLQAVEVLFESRRLPEAEYSFTHVLIQEVAYHAVVRRTRQELHARLLDLLTTQFPDRGFGQAALLAHHATSAGLIAEAASHWERAGQHAMERSACVEATKHFTAGLELLAVLPLTPDLQRHELALRLARGNALIATKGYADPDVEDNYAQALALCRELPETPELGLALAGIETFYFARGKLSTAHELASQCLSLAPLEPVRLQQAHQAMGRILLMRGEPLPARDQLERAIALDDADRYELPVAQYGTAPGVASRVWASVAQWLLGEEEQALRTSRSAQELASALRHPLSQAYALAVGGLIDELRGDISAVKVNAEGLLALTSEQGFAFWGVVGTIRRGWVRAAEGRLVEGIAEMRDGLAAWRALGAVLTQPYFLALIAGAHGDAGDTAEGLALVNEAIALADRTGERWWEAELHRLKGELILRSGRPRRKPEAATCFQEALSMAHRQRASALERRAESSLRRLEP